MRKSRHSPGPWVHYVGVLRRTFPVIVHEIHDARGRVVVPWTAFDSPRLPSDVMLDNVQLMTAAPELGAALSEALPFIEKFAAAGNKHAPATLMLIRAALRKAGLLGGKR